MVQWCDMLDVTIQRKMTLRFTEVLAPLELTDLEENQCGLQNLVYVG